MDKMEQFKQDIRDAILNPPENTLLVNGTYSVLITNGEKVYDCLCPLSMNYTKKTGDRQESMIDDRFINRMDRFYEKEYGMNHLESGEFIDGYDYGGKSENHIKNFGVEMKELAKSFGMYKSVEEYLDYPGFDFTTCLIHDGKIFEFNGIKS